MPRVITLCCMVFLFVLFAAFVPPLIAAADDAGDTDRMVLTQAEERLKRRITYSCRNLSIDTVLMQLAEQAQIDIIKSPNVTGDVTVKVTNIPLEEVLNNILAAHGYTYVPTEHMIRVVPLDEAAITREKLVTRIYRITYADVSEVSNALEKFISKQGEIAINKGTNNLMVTDVESKIKAMDSFIEEIDRITPQVLVEVRIYDVTSREGFELGAEWLAARNTPLTSIDHTNAYTRTDTDNSGETQYQVTDGVVEITEIPGVPGYSVEKSDTITKQDSTTYRSKPFVGGSFTRLKGGTLALGILNDAVDMELVLSILQQQVEAKLLANPRVLVLDNETANFKIVREIPYTELTQTGQGSDITSTDFKDVGVELEVTPHVMRDNMLRVHIKPKFGIEVGESQGGAPVVDNREADTTLLVADAQTVVLGGLRKRETSKTVSKVPLLADIPLMGGLFQSEEELVTTNELVVFITPRIITSPTELSEIEQNQLKDTQFDSHDLTKSSAQQ
jgi:type IV pilus assembly protein PilQ